MTTRIEKRPYLQNESSTQDAVEALEERRAVHARLPGKPEKTFGEVLEAKMNPEGKPRPSNAPLPKGAKDPHLGLSPGQDPELAESGKGRRAGRVIVKG